MNVGSLDLQVLIPRSTDVSKVQQNADQQPAMQQQQFAAEWQQISAQRQQQIQNSSKSEGSKIKADERERRQQAKGEHEDSHSQKRQSDPDCPEEHASDPFLGNKVDIKT